MAICPIAVQVYCFDQRAHRPILPFVSPAVKRGDKVFGIIITSAAKQPAVIIHSLPSGQHCEERTIFGIGNLQATCINSTVCVSGLKGRRPWLINLLLWYLSVCPVLYFFRLHCKSVSSGAGASRSFISCCRTGQPEEAVTDFFEDSIFVKSETSFSGRCCWLIQT